VRASTAQLIVDARKNAGLSQAELARRLGTTQSAVARLEARGSSPRVETVARALEACGRRLRLASEPVASDVDETLVEARLRLTPGERLKSFERTYANVRQIALAGLRARGELG
jgi:transcriptional regulator with XRE-family HTH domain